MDDFQRAWYEKAFEVEFIKNRGESFQDFFSTIMERCYPGDFIRTRPWGSLGDRKNDGYLKSKRCLYQVYAPNEMTSEKAISKIDEDFLGALPYWQQYFDTWVFTHNAWDGLGPHIIQKLLELEQSYHPLKVTHCGFVELLGHFRLLKELDVMAIVGAAPSRRDVQSLQLKDIKVILQSIERSVPSLTNNVRPVPPQKLAANALSPEVQELLKIGMIKTRLVRKFFTEWHDPLYGDELANSFNRRYIDLKRQGLLPDEIFWKLQEFVIGEHRGTPTQESAALTILAYFFEACDIFETPHLES